MIYYPTQIIMTEIQNENNGVAEQILALEKTIMEKVLAQGERDDKRSVIRFSKDHWVEVDEYNCLNVTKFHPEYLSANPEELEENITHPKYLPYCTNIMFDEDKLYVHNQIITRKQHGRGYSSEREDSMGLPIETPPYVTINNPATVLRYYQSLNELIDKKLSKVSEIQETLES